MRVTVRIGGVAQECMSLDLSWGGACLTAVKRFPLQIADQVVLTLHPDRDGTDIDVDGETRWLVTSGNSTLFGVRFIGDAGREKMLREVNRMQAEATRDNVLSNVPTFDIDAELHHEGFSGTSQLDVDHVRCVIIASIASLVENIEIEANVTLDASERGTAHVLVNPDGSMPLGLNLELPPHLAADQELVARLRHAIVRARFRQYSGPPQHLTVHFVVRRAVNVEASFDDFDDL